MNEVYISVDIETVGPGPGVHSMISLGAAAVYGGKIKGQFEVNLQEAEGMERDTQTMEWWGTNPEAWAHSTKDALPPKEAMQKFQDWLDEVNPRGRHVFVAYPLGFDFPHVSHYFHRFLGDSPFGWSGLDLKTYAMAVLGTTFRGSCKRTFPKRWFSDRPHTHCALDDALEQADMFIAMHADAQKLEMGTT